MSKQITKAIAAYHLAITPDAVKAALAYSRERGLGLTAASIRADAASQLADDVYAEAAKARESGPLAALTNATASARRGRTALEKVTKSPEMTAIGKVIRANSGGSISRAAKSM